MKTPNNVKNLQLIDTCTGCGIKRWHEYMDNTTKANGSIIRKLIKRHLPDLYYALGLEFYNPYENKCVKKEGLLVYVSSDIEYFLKYN